MPEDDKIDDLLDSWEDGFRPDLGLAARVRASLPGRQEQVPRQQTVADWFGNAFSRPGLAACFAAVFVFAGMGLSQLIRGGLGESKEEATLSYRLSIDPIYRLQAMAGASEFANRPIVPASQGSEEARVLLAGLGWLQGALDLSEPQYQRVTELHSAYEMAFDELFSKLVESHRKFQDFDRKRMDNDVVDYFQLYELLQSQKSLSEESARLTEELLGKVEQVIDPTQRARYRKLLDSVHLRSSGQVASNTDA